ncbi:hypothetical protein [Pedobacter jejuensis]|uniref:Uncharacterized protein n=1 Tax=Pedobacter jejuensis TaxID=1268550 RepID=A0A3N0BPM9_9SPHI|nr:hypothetical protein [Pedobacter jejuensis]RNL50759.1 hypothetical protein D7004_17885 [Pedobacter jejuensis]
MQAIPKPPFTFKEFVKYPIYAVCFLLIIYFMYKEFIEQGFKASEIDRLEKELTRTKTEKNAQINYLQHQVLIDRKKIDSLQGLMLSRTDNSYEELKSMLDLTNKKSTIIIKPKRK